MTTRTSYVATESAGDVLTTTNFDKLPGGWIGYAEVTADQGSITTLVDLTSLSVTVTVNTSRRIKITGHCTFTNNTNADGAALLIREGGTTLQSRSRLNASNAVGEFIIAEVVLTPTSGSHTYKLSAQQIVGGTVTMNASATAPAFILVEDIGPAS